MSCLSGEEPLISQRLGPRCFLSFQPCDGKMWLMAVAVVVFALPFQGLCEFPIYPLVGGFKHEIYFPFHMGCHPSQLTNSIILQDGRSTTNQLYKLVYKPHEYYRIIDTVYHL